MAVLKKWKFACKIFKLGNTCCNEEIKKQIQVIFETKNKIAKLLTILEIEELVDQMKQGNDPALVATTQELSLSEMKLLVDSLFAGNISKAEIVIRKSKGEPKVKIRTTIDLQRSTHLIQKLGDFVGHLEEVNSLLFT